MRALALTALLIVAAVAAVATPAGAAADPQAAVAPGECTNVSFYTLPNRPPPVTIGYSANATTSVFFVLKSGGDVVGHTALQTFDDAIAVDGQDVPLERNLSGVHELTVTPHVDSNGNGEFDPGTDESCGSEYGATLTWFFPNHTDTLTGMLTADTDDAGARTTHHGFLRVDQEVTVRALAVDYLRAPASVRAVARESSNVTASVTVERADGTSAVHFAHVTERQGLLVASLSDPVTIDPGASVRLDVTDVPNPRRNATTALVVNPNGTALTTETYLSVRDGPVSDLAMFPVSDPSPPPVRVGFSVAETTEVGFAVTANGELVGASEFTTVPAGSVVDGFEVPVDANLTGEHKVSVYSVRDSNGNGEVDRSDRPYVHHGRDVHTSRVLSFGGERGTLTAEFSPRAEANVSGVALNLPAVGVGTAGIPDENVSVRVVSSSGERTLEPAVVQSRGGEYVVSLRETTQVRPFETLVVTVDGVAAADRSDDLSLSINPNDGARATDAAFEFTAFDATTTTPSTPTSSAVTTTRDETGTPPTTAEPTTSSDASSPGFSVATALAAVATGLLFARRS